MIGTCSESAKRYADYARWVGGFIKVINDDNSLSLERKKQSIKLFETKIEEWDASDYEKNKNVAEELQKKLIYDFYEAQTWRDLTEANRYIARRMGYEFPGRSVSFYSMKIEEEYRNSVHKNR
jgi:aspartyl/asparaginyl beta-hydroxylase (cupin superfamily)